MARRTKPADIVSLNAEELKTLGRIIGQAMVEELLKHINDFRSPIFRSAAEPPNRTEQKSFIDNSIIDIGVSTEGMETKFDDLVKDDTEKDDKFMTSKMKLAEIKKK